MPVAEWRPLWRSRLSNAGEGRTPPDAEGVVLRLEIKGGGGCVRDNAAEAVDIEMSVITVIKKMMTMAIFLQ